MIKKLKTKAAALIVCAALFSSGCSSSGSSPVTESVSSSQAGNTNVVSGDDSSAAEVPDIPPMKEASVLLKCVSEDEGLMLRKLMPGANDTVLIQYSDDGTVNKCCLIDPINDKVIRTLDLPSFSEQAVGAFADGTVLTYDNSEELEFKLYRSGSSEPEITKISRECYPEIRADIENNRFYWFEFGTAKAYRTDLKGNTTQLDLDENIFSIFDIYPENGVFTARDYSEDTESGLSGGVYSLETGKKLFDIGENDDDRFYADGHFTNVSFATSEDAGYTFFIDQYLSGDGEKIRRYTVEAEADTGFEIKGSGHSSYAALMNYGMGQGSLQHLRFLDLQTGKLGEVEVGENIENTYLYYLKNSGRWIAGLSCVTEGKFSFRLMMIYPSVLDKKTELKSEEIVHAPPASPYTVGESYKPVREYADRVEKEFGVRILVGNEAKLTEESSGYKYTTCEDAFDELSVESDLNALSELRTLLKRYPKGFFDHFKTKDGRFGLRITIVKTLANEGLEHFAAGGAAFTTGRWYDIAIDSYMLNSEDSSFDHEMWHAVEHLIDPDGQIFRDNWEKYNPRGFSYSQDFDGFAEGKYDSNNTFDGAPDSSGTIDFDAVYFISYYSIVTGHEDRATLIERVLSRRTDPDTMELVYNGINDVNKCPHLKAKLDFLAELSKKEFGYVYWEEVLKNIRAE